jgi:hypothetical protein
VDLDRQGAARSEPDTVAPPGKRRAVEVVLVALVAGCVLLLVVGVSGGLDRSATTLQKHAKPGQVGAIHPAAPAPYTIPAGAVSVANERELRAALAAHSRSAIVIAPGTYGGSRPFSNSYGHQLYAARLGETTLTAGLSLGGNQGRGGGLVRGVVVDVSDSRRTVDGAAIAVWGTGTDSRILDTTVRGHGRLSAGVAARRPEGLVIQRVVARGFRNFGVLVDANDGARPPQREPFQISDLDVAGVARPTPGSSLGTAEACVWIGATGSVRRVRARSCAASGLWTGSATRRSSFESIDIDGAQTGVYLEHFTSDSTFRRLRIGPRVRVGLNAEWADPAWNRRPASVRNVIEDSRFESSVVGVYLDEGTKRTTVRRSSFAHQSWGAVGDYRGNHNAVYGNVYEGATAATSPVRHDHLSSAGKRR